MKTLEIGNSQIALRRRVPEFRSPEIQFHGLGFLPSLPINEAGVDHSESRAARGSFQERLKRLVGVGADTAATVLEALPPA